MKIILLRHEERNLEDPRFYTPLTEKGRIQAIKLSEELSNIDIDLIFSSPFERTIQTILPYCIKSGKKINLENSLYEFPNNPIFIDNELYDKESVNSAYEIIINEGYNSILKKEELTFADKNIIIDIEDQENLENRAEFFLNYLLKNYRENDETILIVSHEGVLKKIEKKIFECLNKEHKYEQFNMGEYRTYTMDQDTKDIDIWLESCGTSNIFNLNKI
tara:strand:- start:1048 stop:1704 length:657 start_codon:yes stop_codon:yes gene_type:complete